MSPGDTWRQSFTLTLPAEEGYYDLVVATDITANREENPFVDNEVQFEQWMLVKTSGGGGHLGIGFDESVFADGIAPIPGPFRDKASRRVSGGGGGTAGVGMDSDDVFLSVKYPGKPGLGGAPGRDRHQREVLRQLLGRGLERLRRHVRRERLALSFSTCERRVGGGSWDYRTDVSQLVWCLENRINSQVHNTYFTTAVPSAVRATRGSGWNANDIRDTWTHNLGS